MEKIKNPEDEDFNGRMQKEPLRRNWINEINRCGCI
jgi:hypothetical protein|nr:MAG TPA: hypothetical protein [Caudoviricetes sp.]